MDIDDSDNRQDYMHQFGSDIQQVYPPRAYAHTADNDMMCEDSGGEDNDVQVDTTDSEGKFYAAQISASEYERQTVDYTKSAVAQLLASPEYLRRHTRCQLCWCIWSEGMHSAADRCTECGGYAMVRPCPICQGQCGAVWRRDVDLSHSQYEAHWDGDCLLPEEERQTRLRQFLAANIDDEDVLDGLGDLST